MTPVEVVRAFQAAWDANDLEAVLALVTEDCVFESSRPGTYGERVVGREALRAAWAPAFAAPSGGFEIEDLIDAGDRVIELWRHVTADRSTRGVDVLRVRDGRVAEKFGYTKS